MTLSDFRDQLREAGFDVPASTLKHLARIGQLGEVELDGAQNRIYGAKHFARAIQYFSKPRRRGRRPRAEQLSPATA